MKIFRLIFILFLIFSTPLASFAQKVKTVSGEYIYLPPETQSLVEAKNTAVQRAQIQILADTFGTEVSMTSTTSVSNINGGSDVSMIALGESTVRGEWIETVGEPEFTLSISEEGELVVTVSLTGKVRELIRSTADLEVRILKNGTEDEFESTDFKSNDRLFLSFRSPVDGYLAVYLYDGVENVYRLLPYPGAQIVRTQEGVRYVFLSPDYTYDGMPRLPHDIVLTTGQDLELNRIYVVWSPNLFYKAVDQEVDGLPVLGYQHFSKWLSSLRVKDVDVVVNAIDITIKN